MVVVVPGERGGRAEDTVCGIDQCRRSVPSIKASGASKLHHKARTATSNCCARLARTASPGLAKGGQRQPPHIGGQVAGVVGPLAPDVAGAATQQGRQCTLCACDADAWLLVAYRALFRLQLLPPRFLPVDQPGDVPHEDLAHRARPHQARPAAPVEEGGILNRGEGVLKGKGQQDGWGHAKPQLDCMHMS